VIRLSIPEEELMRSGHVACQGCGAALAMRYALKALGKKTIVSIPACCWAVIPGIWPSRNLEVPLLYTAFETTGASISGIKAALEAKGEDDVVVMGWAGDGGTADIGIQALSGMIERQTDALYVMYDNEAYMNTGIQRSSSTPEGAWTTTTPVGKKREWKSTPKKNMVEIAVAHGIPYAATASVGYPEDMIRKFRKAAEIKGPKFIQVYAPCPTGWKMDPSKLVEVCKKAVTSHVFPLYEVERGVYTVNLKPKKTPLKEYLKMQGRFKHLPDDFIEELDRKVEYQWNLLLKKEEFTHRLKEELGSAQLVFDKRE